MKHVKMLGLAALAAMAAMALVASSASATALYNGANERLGAGAVLETTLTGGSATKTSTSGTLLDTCTGSAVSGSISNAGGAGTNVSGNISSLAWEPCTEPTETQNANKGSLEIAQIGTTTNGTVTGKNSIVNVNTTIFGAICEYTTGAGTDLGELKGATGTGHATLAINTVIAAKNSFFCPDAVWKMDYTVTSPAGLHVEAE